MSDTCPNCGDDTAIFVQTKTLTETEAATVKEILLRSAMRYRNDECYADANRLEEIARKL